MEKLQLSWLDKPGMHKRRIRLSSHRVAWALQVLELEFYAREQEEVGEQEKTDGGPSPRNCP